MRAEAPPLHFYRYLYDAIGREYYWIDRKDITDAALAELIQHPDVHIHVAYVAGVPAGFFELDVQRIEGIVRIEDQLEPDPVTHERYNELFDLYRRSDRTLAPIASGLRSFENRYPGGSG